MIFGGISILFIYLYDLAHVSASPLVTKLGSYKQSASVTAAGGAGDNNVA